MSREINPFGLRMPPELRTALEQAAQRAGRSLNAELVRRLEESFEWEKADPMADSQYSEKLSSMDSQIGSLKDHLDKLTKLISDGPPKGAAKRGSRK